MATSSLLMKFVLLGLLSTVVAGGAHCIGNLHIDEFDAFMLNATRTLNAQSAFVEVSEGAESEGAETTNIGFERSAPFNGITVLELCTNIEIPVGPVKAQVVLDGFLTSGVGPLIHGIAGTAKVAAVLGFGWLKGSVEVKGSLSLEATNCKSWSSVLHTWTAAVMDKAMEADEIKSQAKDEKSKHQWEALHGKFKDAEAHYLSEFENADKGSDKKMSAKKMSAGVKAGLAGKLLAATQAKIDKMPGKCGLVWSAGVSVGVSAAGSEGCGEWPWVFLQDGYMWSQTVLQGKVIEQDKEAGGTIKITPVCSSTYCFQLSASYNKEKTLHLSTVFYFPADQSLGAAIPSQIFGMVNDAKDEDELAEKLGAPLIAMKNAVKGLKGTDAAKNFAKGAAVNTANGQAQNLIAGAVGGPAAGLIVTLLFETMSNLKESLTDAQTDKTYKDAKSIRKKITAMTDGFFKALGKKTEDTLKESKQDFAQFALQSAGISQQDNLAFQIDFKRDKKGKKTLSGSISALSVESAGSGQGAVGKLLALAGSISGVYQTGKSFDLFGSEAMQKKVWEPLSAGGATTKTKFKQQLRGWGAPSRLTHNQ